MRRAARAAPTTRSAAAWFTTDNETDNNEFDNTTLSATAGVPLGAPRIASRGGARRARPGRAPPARRRFGRADIDAFFQRRDGVGGVTFLQDLGVRLHASGDLRAGGDSHQASTNLPRTRPTRPRSARASRRSSSSTSSTTAAVDLRRHYATYQADWRPVTGGRYGDHQMTTALDWDGERGTLNDALAGTRASVARRDNVGWTLQHQAMWSRFFAAASVRVEQNDSFGTATVPRVAAAFVVRPSRGAVGETRLKASAGRGIKEPTIPQSYSLSPFFLGNPDLEPERSRSVDAGIEQRLAHDRLKIEPPGSTAATATSSRPVRSASIRSARSTSTSA